MKPRSLGQCVLLFVGLLVVRPAFAGGRAESGRSAESPRVNARPGTAVPDPSQPGAAEHPVGAEDLLDISVFEIPELTRTVRVSEKGTISLPLIGEMEVV